MDLNSTSYALPAGLATPFFVHNPVMMGFFGVSAMLIIGYVLWQQMQSIPKDD